MSKYKSLIASLNYKSFYPAFNADVILDTILKSDISEFTDEVICTKDDQLKNFLLDTRAQLDYNKTFIFKATSQLEPHLIVQFILPVNSKQSLADYIMLDPRIGDLTMNLTGGNIGIFRDKETFLGMPLNYLKGIYDQNKVEIDYFTVMQNPMGYFFDLTCNDSQDIKEFFMTDEEWVVAHAGSNLKVFVQELLNLLVRRNNYLISDDATFSYFGKNFTASFIKEMATKYIPENMKLFDKLANDSKVNKESIKAIEKDNSILVSQFFNDCNKELFK